MLNQSLPVWGVQWTEHLMWIFCRVWTVQWTVCVICRCHISDIVTTSQIQTSSSPFLASIKLSEVSWWQRHIAWPGVTGYDDTPCVLLSSLTPAIYSSPGPRVCRALGCNWTLWPPISEYHRDHDRHQQLAPSVFSLWRYHDTNTNNDISDERQVLRVILTNCQSQRCVVNTSHTPLKLSISNSAWMSNVCRVLWPHIPVYAGLLVTSEHTAVMWQC